MHRTVAGRFLNLFRLDRYAAFAPFDAASVEALVPLARFEGVGAWFWHRLVETGESSTSTSVEATLRELSRIDAALSLRLAVTAQKVLELLDRQGIRTVPLKGIAYRALGPQIPYFRYRATGDIDLLVEPGAAERAWQLLVEAGFHRTQTPSVHLDHHHQPTLIGDLQVPVEIHSAASLFWSDEVSWQRMTNGSRRISWQGATLEVSSSTELCWHALIHSLGDGSPGCRLRSFLTVAALLRDESLDWTLFLTRFDQERIREHDSRHLVPVRAARCWLSIAAWLGGKDLPAGIGAASAIPDLVRLLEFRRGRLAGWPETATAQARTTLRMEEGTRAALRLGLRRLGHWQPKRRRPQTMASSLLYQTLYRLRDWIPSEGWPRSAPGRLSARFPTAPAGSGGAET